MKIFAPVRQDPKNQPTLPRVRRRRGRGVPRRPLYY